MMRGNIFKKGNKISQKTVHDILPGVAVVIFNKARDKVLLQKRTDMGLWGLICGHVEPCESVEEAAIREVGEETGLEVKITRLIGVYSSPDYQIIEYPDGHTSHFVTTYFEAERTGGKLSNNSSETLDLTFFSVDNLPDEMLFMNPHWLEDALSGQREGFIR